MKVKPRKGGRLLRRAVTISAYAVAWLILSSSMPLWLLAASVVGLTRGRSFVLLRLLIFAWFYFGFELIALVLVALVFVFLRPGESRTRALYALQAWWASVNLGAAQQLLGLRITVDGADLGVPGPCILMIRHASILDTLLPCTYVQRPHGFRVRYVVKQELLVDPCIDIVGNALPNYFIDRSGDRVAELEGMRTLVRDLGTDGVLLFPEGTRFSPEKRRRALDKLAAEGDAFATEARALTHVLPPKPGGVLTLLDALPDVDCVFVAHSGLEDFAEIRHLWSGEVVGKSVRVKLWRIPGNDIPTGDPERLHWLYGEWKKVDAFVKNELKTP